MEPTSIDIRQSHSLDVFKRKLKHTCSVTSTHCFNLTLCFDKQ